MKNSCEETKIIVFGRKKIGFLNAGSLGTGHDELVVAIDRHRLDILALNETWLKEGEEGRAPIVPGYRLRHKPRPVAASRSRGGGVGYYIKKGISVEVISHPENPIVEQMWVSTRVKGKRIIIGTAYRPPWLKARIFLDALTDTFASLTSYDHIFLLGDFNINILCKSSSLTRMLYEFLKVTNMQQYVDSPTHFTSHSETLIDLICSNTQPIGVRVDYVCSLSDHAILSCEVGVRKDTKHSNRIHFRQLKGINDNEFSELMNIIGWPEVQPTEGVDYMTSDLNDKILKVFDILSPLKLRHFKDVGYPWITYNIKLMMKKRDEAHKRARSTKSENHIVFYKNLKRTVQSAIYREKCVYYKTFINNNLKNSAYLWKNLKRYVAFKTKKKPYFAIKS
ncbi:uncharacterized protein LOC123668419 [Melitaea cinxia]|uniref:uncharacterized protein LOC123668419 n=1 Tax=Melitaea cinxia TaxID=113334 RepID=UPI001E270CFA|nr:uncharacterized protein LOC123668419 [Melitaea cinxia]